MREVPGAPLAEGQVLLFRMRARRVAKHLGVLSAGPGGWALGGAPGLPAFDAAGSERQANVNSPSGLSDFETALQMLGEELPRVRSGLMIVSWFGDDLRCAECAIRPKVEYRRREGVNQPWRVSGLVRGGAQELARLGEDPVYGGTPSDASVLQAIRAMQAAGQKVVYYPFILMEQLAGNGLPDPWTGAEDQPPLPWRGRITLSVAPGREGSPDRSAGAEAEVAAFFGTVGPEDFTVGEEGVVYTGPEEWSYRRFILHQAALCAAAGGVDAFCIGSEMVALTRIRGAGDSFPAVAQMIALLRDVRAMLGAGVKLTYAADWSEYFGCTDAEGNRYFHLDPLWSDEDVDVIGIDNYMPLSDWRDGEGHLDAAGGRSIHDLAYLRGNVAGGEGFDWYYASDHARAVQERMPIADGLIGEDWIWRYKDLRAWWENPHFERIDGMRALEATDWEPRSKPFWFTELGCAAIDKGTNQPNKFLDPKSSESALPYFSNGGRDDLIQMQYLRAMAAYWTDPLNNPHSEVYGGRMLDWDRAHVWAWDARPFPWFPGNRELWSDGGNWARGHWLTGRAMHQPLSAVVAEICETAGLREYDVSGLHGVVRGYAVSSTETGRAALQPLMLAHGFEALERDGRVIFRMRDGQAAGELEPGLLVARDGGDLEVARGAAPEAVGRVRLNYLEAEGDFEIRAAEAALPDAASGEVSQSELALLLTRGEARATIRCWMAEARIARDVARFSLPPSTPYGVGDVVALPHEGTLRHYRIDRIELTGAREVEAVRVEPGVYRGGDPAEDALALRRFEALVPVMPLFLDLPLMRGDEVAHAPHLAVAARPWPGAVAVYDAPFEGGDFALNTTIAARAVIGRAVTPLHRMRPALWSRGGGVDVAMPHWVTLASAGSGE
ncbi:MAG TPA: host specificity protein, partial [Paracoccus sp.]|nr:host specificity protein [Paracoccus sp. (in: a-proteobacteria)]